VISFSGVFHRSIHPSPCINHQCACMALWQHGPRRQQTRSTEQQRPAALPWLWLCARSAPSTCTRPQDSGVACAVRIHCARMCCGRACCTKPLGSMALRRHGPEPSNDRPPTHPPVCPYGFGSQCNATSRFVVLEMQYRSTANVAFASFTLQRREHDLNKHHGLNILCLVFMRKRFVCWFLLGQGV
jgi:hypothetical protein